MSRILKLLPVWFLAVSTLAPAGAQAQVPEPTPPREHITAGFAGSAVLEPWLMPAVRVSLPLGQYFSLDLDAARVLGSNKYSRPGPAMGGQLRFMRGRSPEGVGRYWLVGAMLIRHESLRDGVVDDRSPLGVLRGGYGWDQLFRNGLRVSFEIGGQGADLPLPFVSLAVQWGRPRRPPAQAALTAAARRTASAMAMRQGCPSPWDA